VVYCRLLYWIQDSSGLYYSIVPKIGQHVIVTWRYLIEFPEVAGGLAELHPFMQ
jgi:hypothetical protein